MIGRGVYIVGMTYVGPEETDEYGTCDDFAMLCSDGSVYLFSMAYYTNAYGRKTMACTPARCSATCRT